MKLELLPNEILLDLFDYFDGIDLLRAFFGLNSRINILLYHQFQNYRFNFDSVSKRNFDMICQQYLPFITNRIITLSLSDSDETPTQINLFLSYVPSFNQFLYIRSLSITDFRTQDILIKILEQCYHLPNLTHLTLKSYFFEDNQLDFQLIINNIWSLSTLIYWKFNIGLRQQTIFPKPIKISTSLKSISIEGYEFAMKKINQLFEYTPYLECLNVHLNLFKPNDYKPYTLSTLTHLKLHTYAMTHTINIEIFESMPNLYRLDIILRYGLLYGNQLEQLIRNYLPKLKVFRLKMEEEISGSSEYIEEYAEKLIQSFQTPFWIKEHQWFVRCFIQNNSIHAYSLSKKFSYSEDKLPHLFKSTYPNDDYQDFYNNINNISDETFFDQLIPYHIRLINIENLCIELPVNNQFWSIIPSLNRLNSLTVISYIENFPSQLQNLLNLAPNLHYLDIHQDEGLPLSTLIFQCTNKSIYQLDFRNYNYSFNEEECIQLSRSPLGIQCEVLSIVVTDRECIIYLINNMKNLRSLQIECEDKMETNDDLIEWLKHRLPSMYLITNNPNRVDRILIWI